jgi:hypothetical protein
MASGTPLTYGIEVRLAQSDHRLGQFFIERAVLLAESHAGPGGAHASAPVPMR